MKGVRARERAKFAMKGYTSAAQLDLNHPWEE